MNTNRFESPKSRTVKPPEFMGVGPAWWGLAGAATFVFVFAIAWLLTHSP
jgi:hypothetical protein